MSLRIIENKAGHQRKLAVWLVCMNCSPGCNRRARPWECKRKLHDYERIRWVDGIGTSTLPHLFCAQFSQGLEFGTSALLSGFAGVFCDQGMVIELPRVKCPHSVRRIL